MLPKRLLAITILVISVAKLRALDEIGSDEYLGLGCGDYYSDFRFSMDRLAERFAEDRANPYNAKVISYWKQAYLAYTFDRLKRSAPLDLTIGREIEPSCTSEAVTTDDKGGVTVMKVKAPAGYHFKAWNDAELDPYWRKSLTAYGDQARAIESDWCDVCKLVDDPRTSAATITQMQNLMRANPETRK